MLRIICGTCGRDINQIGQDNVSYTNTPLCEDCFDLSSHAQGDGFYLGFDLAQRERDEMLR